MYSSPKGLNVTERLYFVIKIVLMASEECGYFHCPVLTTFSPGDSGMYIF